MGEEAEVILRSGGEDDPRKFDALLPRQAVVLAPEQTPMSIEETEDIWISSMGFASDGCFHIRLGLAKGVRPIGTGETIWETFNTWSFESPTDLEDVVALELAGERIPI